MAGTADRLESPSSVAPLRPASEWAAWINSWTRTSAALHEDPPELADAAARRMADILTGVDDLDDEDGRDGTGEPDRAHGGCQDGEEGASRLGLPDGGVAGR